MSETVEEWAVRDADGALIQFVGGKASAEAHARAEKEWFDTRFPPIPATLIKRTVTYSDWQEVNDD